MRLLLGGFAAAILIAGCDSPIQPRSAVPTPPPLPAGGRIIEVGQNVESSLGWDDDPLLFRLTAPVSGTLELRVTWSFPVCASTSYAVNYNGRYTSGESAAVVIIRVNAGWTYDFTVSNQNVCGWEPLFVLSTEIG